MAHPIEYWFLIVLVLNLFHEIEEVRTYASWRKKQLSISQHRIKTILTQITPRKMMFMILLQLVLFTGIFLYYRWEEAFYPFLFGISLWYYLHFFIHIIQSLLFKRHIPGIYSSIFWIITWAFYINHYLYIAWSNTLQFLTSLFITFLFYCLLWLYFFLTPRESYAPKT